MVDIRTVRESDLADFRRLHNTYVDRDESLDTVRDRYQDTPGLLLGACDDGTLVGHCLGQPRSADEVELAGIAVGSLTAAGASAQRCSARSRSERRRWGSGGSVSALRAGTSTGFTSRTGTRPRAFSSGFPLTSLHRSTGTRVTRLATCDPRTEHGPLHRRRRV